MRFGRPKYGTGYVADPARVPHEDPRVEARLQAILSRYAAIRRTEERLAVISTEQERVEAKARRNAGEGGTLIRSLTEQSVRLRAERLELEALVSAAHNEVSQILDALGDDALYLGIIR